MFGKINSYDEEATVQTIMYLSCMVCLGDKVWIFKIIPFKKMTVTAPNLKIDYQTNNAAINARYN